MENIIKNQIHFKNVQIIDDYSSNNEDDYFEFDDKSMCESDIDSSVVGIKIQQY